MMRRNWDLEQAVLLILLLSFSCLLWSCGWNNLRTEMLPPSPPMKGAIPYALKSADLREEKLLQELLIKKTSLSKGSGQHIKALQRGFAKLWYNQPVSADTGEYGRELIQVIREFQFDQGTFDVNGVMDAATLQRLDEKLLEPHQSKAFRFDQIYKDKLLDITISVGFNQIVDYSKHIASIEQLFRSLGFQVLGGNAPRRNGWREAKAIYEKVGISVPYRKGIFYYNPSCTYFHSEPVACIFRLVTNFGSVGKEAFLEALQHSDVVIYTGHGRLGSGPDFDDEDTVKGNVWINKYETVPDSHTKKVYNILRSQASTELENIHFSNKYRIWFFDACWSSHYLTAIREFYISSVTVDLLGWNGLIDKGTTAINIKSIISSILDRIDIESFSLRLQNAYRLWQDQTSASGISKKRNKKREESVPQVSNEGFGDNPASQS